MKSPADSRRAAAGWAGDRYALYEGPGGQIFLAQVALWDTENDAREFFDAYVKRTELRYPDAMPSDQTHSKSEGPVSKLETRNTEPEMRSASAETGDSYSWTTSQGRVVIELRGLRVVILEGIPEGADSNLLRKAFSQ